MISERKYANYKTKLLTWISSVSGRTIIENENTGEIGFSELKIFGIASVVQCAVMPEEALFEEATFVVELIGHATTVNFHAGGEHYEIVPLTHLK